MVKVVLIAPKGHKAVVKLERLPAVNDILTVKASDVLALLSGRTTQSTFTSRLRVIENQGVYSVTGWRDLPHIDVRPAAE